MTNARASRIGLSMRIAIINTLYPPSDVGGAERSVAILAEALAAGGDAVHVIALADVSKTSIERISGVTVHRLPHGKPYWPFDSKHRNPLDRLNWHVRDRGRAAVTESVIAILEAVRPDVVNTNNLTGFGAATIPAARSLGIPVVHTLRDFSLLCARASLFRNGRDCVPRCLSCRLMTGHRMRAAASAGMVIGNSTYMIARHRAEGLFRDTPSRRIFNAVPDLAINADNAPVMQGDGVLRFGFAGLVKPEKGIELLLNACRALPATGWSLAVAGRGEAGYVNDLAGRNADLPVEWLGFVPIDHFYSNVDVVVIPSIWPEPMPRVLIEAMARGIPVIVSDAGGSHEVAALYSGAKSYASNDSDALAGIMRKAMEDIPGRKMPDPSLLEKFGTKRLAAEYRSAYRSAIHHQAGRDRNA